MLEVIYDYFERITSIFIKKDLIISRKKITFQYLEKSAENKALQT